MYIKALTLKNFKRFDKLAIDFPADLTVIKGSNEKGKSTLVEAFVAVFFYDPAKSNKAIEALRSWNSKDLYTITLSFEVEGEEYVLVKDFEKKNISLTNQTTGHLWNTYQDVQNVLADLGGYRSQALFENIAVLGGETMGFLKDGKRALDETLQNILFTSSPGVSLGEILKKIDKAIEDLERGLGGHATKYPGKIKTRGDEISKLGEERKKTEEISTRREAQRKELEDLKKSLSRLDQELDLARRQLKENQTYFSATLEIKKISEALKSIEKKRNELLSLESKKAELSTALEPLRKLERVDFSKIHQLEKELEVARHDLESVAKDLEHIPREPAKVISFLVPQYAIPLFLLFAAGFGGFLFSSFFFFSWVLLFGILAVLFFSSRRKGTHHSPRALKAEFKTKRDRKERLEELLSRTFSVFGVLGEEELRDRVKQYETLKTEYEKLAGKEEGMLEGSTREAVQEQYQSLLRKLAGEEEKVSAEQKVHPPTERDERLLEKQEEELEREKIGLEKEGARMEAIISELKVGAEDIYRIEEEIAAKTQDLEREKDRLEILRILKVKLTESKQEAAKDMRVQAEGTMQKFFSEITDARYSKVAIDENLNFKVYSEEKSDHIVPEEGLSRGTIDQFYLVARFAFLEIFFGRVLEKEPARRPLIILDDPFHTFDAARRSRARILLQSFSERFQIVLLTHSDLYDDWGTVRELPSP